MADDFARDDLLTWFTTEHERTAVFWPYHRFDSGEDMPPAADTLHQLADTLIEVAAQSPTVIAGGLLVAARALLDYTERQVAHG